MKVNVNGKLLEAEDAVVPALDYGLVYGYGVFETIRVYGGVPFRFEKHSERMREGASAIGLPAPPADDILLKEIGKTMAASNLSNAAVKFVWTFGVGGLRLLFPDEPSPNFIILVEEVPDYTGRWGNGIRVGVSETVTRNERSLLSRVKSLNYLESLLARREAISRGLDDVLVLNTQGCVAEAGSSNIFIIKEGALTTPPLSAGALPGITRATVLDIIREEGLKAEEQDIRAADVSAADEVFLTSSITGVTPVIEVDGKPIGDGIPCEFTRRIHGLYRRLVEGEAGTF